MKRSLLFMLLLLQLLLLLSLLAMDIFCDAEIVLPRSIIVEWCWKAAAADWLQAATRRSRSMKNLIVVVY